MALEQFNIRPLTEGDIEEVVALAGGRRAHPDHDRRSEQGADFLLGDSIIELKALDEEGMAKPERQQKLATLFGAHSPGRPVVVLDRGALPDDAQRTFDRIVEGPIKTGVASARKQLRQSRVEFPDASCNVLFILNNGYTALDHDSLVRLVAHRVRQDTSEIDGVVVAGCYFYSDTFDSFFMWPMDYVPINVDRPFKEYDALHTAWHGLAERYMTDLMTGRLGPDLAKGPVIDTQFEVGPTVYVKPTPPMGRQSDFFGPQRPRKDTSGLTSCPPVAITFPAMAKHTWQLFKHALPHEPELRSTYDAWRRGEAEASETGKPLKPFVPMSVTYPGWEMWCADRGVPRSMSSVRHYANVLFDQEVRRVMSAARERTPSTILPPRYMLAVIEEIGQDRANDISHIAAVRERPGRSPAVKPVLEDARMHRDYALALASSHAVAEGLDHVLWQENLTYAWR